MRNAECETRNAEFDRSDLEVDSHLRL
jgi:hypothetical protein